ncbi:Hypothetical predicted protein [Mytilus galloprovincialis]|uniref:Uncharacterized protein n=1 Tax=Mytilus galloprovincialis TaxID=29158 RepID=A0A8B6FNA6_MYTGA|nr:Hypothetical predicted protein [Mytilus galloprovincialis]
MGYNEYNGNMGYMGYNSYMGSTGNMGFNSNIGYTGNMGFNSNIGYTGNMGYDGLLVTRKDVKIMTLPIAAIRAIFPSLRKKAQQEIFLVAVFLKEIKEKNMDCVYFPDIYSISSVTHRTIDVFTTISESLEVNFNSETADFPREQIKTVMHKMMAYRQNIEFPEINKLFYLLTEMVLGVVGTHETASNSSTKTSVAGRIQNKFVKLVSASDSILPIPTFDQIKTEEYQAQIDEMQTLRRAHTYLYKDLQRQQEMCWIANSKVQKYELCLRTAKLSRNHLADKLSSKNLKALDDSITQLQTTLNHKIQKAEESNQRYQTLLTKEKVTRNALKLVSLREKNHIFIV